MEENTRRAIEYVVRGAVRAEIEGTATRPQTPPLKDWRQTFFIRRTPNGEVMATIQHRFPVDPTPGQVWRIPTRDFSDDGDHISIKIDHVTYQWEGLKNSDSQNLAGWLLNIYVECYRWPQ